MSHHITLAAATAIELIPLLSFLGLSESGNSSWIEKNGILFNSLVTGPGIPQTSFQLGRFLASHTPDLLVHVGIAGCVKDRFEIGSCVRVTEDRFADLGAESESGNLIDMFDLGLWEEGSGIWSERCLRPNPEVWSGTSIPPARGITVNLIPGTARSIQQMSDRFHFDIESMEGAAVFHAALETGIPVACFRGISNVIEPRNRPSWDIQGALNSISATVGPLLLQLDDRPLFDQVLS